MSLPRSLCPLLCALVVLLALPATSAAAATATVGTIDCDAGGAIVTMRTDAGAPQRFTIQRDGATIAAATVPAGAPVRRVVPIAEGAAAQVTVLHGSSYVSAYVRRACAGSAAPSSAADAPANSVVVRADDAPFVSAPVVPGTGARGSGAGEPRPAEPTASGDVTLEEPAPSWPLLLTALLALLALAAVAGTMVRTRFRPTAARRAPAAPPPA